MIPVPACAMVLAAGLGLRLRPLTNDRPKPLVRVGGSTILDHVLDRLAEAGVRDCVVNTHYLGSMIADHLATRAMPRISLSEETTRLETGGGILRVIDRFSGLPFFAVNADILWDDPAPVPALRRLAEAFDPGRMDVLLLVVSMPQTVGYDGAGDFFLDPATPHGPGRLVRRGEARTAPFVFTGIQILTPAAFDGAPEGAFSLNHVYDRARKEGRLWGLAHAGRWYHVGTPAALALAEKGMAEPGMAALGRNRQGSGGG